MKHQSTTLYIIIAAVSLAIALLLIFLTWTPKLGDENIDQIPDTPTVTETTPLYITTMTHYEGNWNVNEIFFNQVIERSEFGMDIADDYDAKLTFESEKPFALASIEFDKNYLQEIIDRGHGVGTHCDFGLNSRFESLFGYFAQASKNKTLVDNLVGKRNNLGCSGGGGEWDWVIGLSEAGFSYIDGIVAAHYLSMPLEARPDGWTDEFIRDEVFHDNAPYELEDRIYPIWLSDAQDFVEDKNGTLAMMGGNLGRISFLEESRDATCAQDNSCALTKGDVDIAIGLIEEVLEIRDPERFAKITFYIPTADLVEKNEEVLRYFFEEVAKFEDDLQWATQKEAYEAFVEFSR